MDAENILQDAAMAAATTVWRTQGAPMVLPLTIAMAASWLPLAADYTRFARTGKSAFWGTALGYFVPLVWLFSLGAIVPVVPAASGISTV